MVNFTFSVMGAGSPKRNNEEDMTQELKQKTPLSIGSEPHVDQKGRIIPDQITSRAEHTVFCSQSMQTNLILASYGIPTPGCPITNFLASTQGGHLDVRKQYQDTIKENYTNIIKKEGQEERPLAAKSQKQEEQDKAQREEKARQMLKAYQLKPAA
jgi:hypothetical protein